MGNLRTGNKRHNRVIAKAAAAAKAVVEAPIAAVKKAVAKG